MESRKVRDDFGKPRDVGGIRFKGEKEGRKGR